MRQCLSIIFCAFACASLAVATASIPDDGTCSAKWLITTVVYQQSQMQSRAFVQTKQTVCAIEHTDNAGTTC